MNYEALQEHNDEVRQRERDAAWELELELQEVNQLISGYQDGKRGDQPRYFTQPYLECWAVGFAALVRERHENGWKPVLEFRYVRNPYGAVDGDPSEFTGNEIF